MKSPVLLLFPKQGSVRNARLSDIWSRFLRLNFLGRIWFARTNSRNENFESWGEWEKYLNSLKYGWYEVISLSI